MGIIPRSMNLSDDEGDNTGNPQAPTPTPARTKDEPTQG